MILISRATTAGNGAAVEHHALGKIELSADGDAFMVHIASWANEQARIDNTAPSALSHVRVPLAAMGASSGFIDDLIAGIAATEATLSGAVKVNDGSMTLANLKRMKWVAIKAQAVIASNADITVSTRTFLADQAERAEMAYKMAIAILAAQDGITFSVDWPLANGTAQTLNANQFKALTRAIDARNDGYRAAAVLKKAEIEAATTPAEVDAVVWP